VVVVLAEEAISVSPLPRAAEALRRPLQIIHEEGYSSEPGLEHHREGAAPLSPELAPQDDLSIIRQTQKKLGLFGVNHRTLRIGEAVAPLKIL